METSQPAMSPVDRLQVGNIVLGIWILASTYLLQSVIYDGARLTNGLFGPFIMGVAILQLSLEKRMRWIPVSNVVMGVIVAAAPFLFNFTASTAGTISNVVAGALVALIALAAVLRG